MVPMLKDEINGLTLAREEADRENPGCLWGNGDLML
jgi:hypothetical protein